jgi:hypothetical protein
MMIGKQRSMPAANFRPNGRLFTLGSFLENTEVFFSYLFLSTDYVLILTEKGFVDKLI